MNLKFPELPKDLVLHADRTCPHLPCGIVDEGDDVPVSICRFHGHGTAYIGVDQIKFLCLRGPLESEGSPMLLAHQEVLAPIQVHILHIYEGSILH